MTLEQMVASYNFAELEAHDVGATLVCCGTKPGVSKAS